MHLLPPPYKSQCRDYNKEELNSQVTCMRWYEYEMYKSKGEVLPFRTPVPQTWPQNERMATRKASISNEFDHITSSKCSQRDCRIDIYSPFTMASAEGVLKPGFAMVLPTEPALFITYTPRMGLDEFLALVSSVLGLWIGFTLFGALDVLFEISDYVKRRNQRRIAA